MVMSRCAVLGTRHGPFPVLFDAVAPDIVAVLSSACNNTPWPPPGDCSYSSAELFMDLCRARHQAVHELCVKEVAVSDAVLE